MVTNLQQFATSLLSTPIKQVKQYIKSIDEQHQIKKTEAMPYHELEAHHVKNTSTVPNREALLAQFVHGGTVAEIGVDQGEFSELILKICQPSKFYLVDAWGNERYNAHKEAQVRDKFKEQTQSGMMEIRKGYSTNILPEFQDKYFDWVYIDTNHLYPTTYEELVLASQKVKPGGIIAGHDYVTGNWNRRVRYGVIEAVHEFCVKYNWEEIGRASCRERVFPVV